jgi:phosphoribosylglycinamide formyltransferase 1
VRTALLISGRGSNMVSLLEAMRAPGYPAQPVLVVSNRADAGGLARAGEVPTRIVESRGRTREEFEAALDAALHEARVEFIALAGFLRVLTPGFVARWAGRMVNIHPSLLPLFPGLDTHARALAAGVRVHGCTVHWVSAEVDGGAIIGQAAVPVLAGDTEVALAARVLAAEHRLYPVALAAALGHPGVAAGDMILSAGGH